MARRTPSTRDRQEGFREILVRRTWNRLGFELYRLPEDTLRHLWEVFLLDVQAAGKQVRWRDLWPRFDARLDDVLGREMVRRLRKKWKRS